MKGSHAVVCLVLVCAVVLVSGIGGLAGLARAPQPEEALGTAFTYQGRLTDDGSPGEGAYDFQFKLYDAFAGGNLLGTVTPGDVAVSGGLFTVKLDFGSGVLHGDARWLEIGVRPGDSGGAYTLLDPRQELTPSPYALALPGLWTQQNGVSPNLIGGYSGNWTTTGVTGATIGGGGEINWRNRVTDNFGAVSGGYGNQAGDDAGLTDDAESATVGGGWQNIAGRDWATVGGGWRNIAGGDSATVGGGGDNTADGSGATIAGGYSNIASAERAAVGGGQSNEASGGRATIAGGNHNTASGWNATIGGGETNTASGSDSPTIGGGYHNVAGGNRATVGGGSENSAAGWGAVVAGGGLNIAGGNGATVGGGYSNTVSIDGATIAGGYGNVAGGNASVIGGGNGNVVTGGASTISGGGNNQADGDTASVGGGSGNSAGGPSSTVGGGLRNSAGESFATIAGGVDNTAGGVGATVGGGGGNTANASFATIGGGGDNQASGEYATVPGGTFNLAQGSYSLAAGRHAKAYNQGCFVWGDYSTDNDVACNADNRWVARASGGVYFYTSSGLGSGVYVPAGDSAWSSVSDRNLKENAAAVDGQEVLARLAQVPITSWNYKSQDAAIRHMGPMAQDFYSAFGLGEDDTHISTVDADGVALAAIQGLYAENQALKAKNADQEAQIATLQEENAGLDARLTALEQAVGSGQPTQARSSTAVPWLVAGGLVVAGGTVAGWRRWQGGER